MSGAREWKGFTGMVWIGINSDLCFSREPDRPAQTIYDREEDVPEGLTPTRTHLLLFPVEQHNDQYNGCRPTIDSDDPVWVCFERLQQAAQAYFDRLHLASVEGDSPYVVSVDPDQESK